jgi:acylphosphatase
VQGIGFRGFVRANARKLGLTGFVQNLDDGKVGVLAQGSKDKLEELVKFCRKGPFLAEVKSVDVSWEDKEEDYQSFELVH